MNIAFILNFLRQLQQNNEKGWMDAHRDQYEAARGEFKSLVAYDKNRVNERFAISNKKQIRNATGIPFRFVKQRTTSKSTNIERTESVGVNYRVA